MAEAQAQQKKLTPKQEEFVRRAFKKDSQHSLPFFSRGKEINNRANALSSLREVLAEQMKNAEGDPEETEKIRVELEAVAKKLAEYGALEVRPRWIGKGAVQAKKEKAAAGMILRMQGINERYLGKAAWCLRNSVPIMEKNLARSKKYLVEAAEQDKTAAEQSKTGIHEIYDGKDGKVLMLSRWQRLAGGANAPARGFCAYFAPNDGTVVIGSFNPKSRGFITHYPDGTTDALQYPDVRRPKSAAEVEVNRNYFERELGDAADWLLRHKKELDRRIRDGEIRLG